MLILSLRGLAMTLGPQHRNSNPGFHSLRTFCLELAQHAPILHSKIVNVCPYSHIVYL